MAFAGFASIVGILGRRSSRDDPHLDAARMRGMVFFSLLVVVFALVPVAFGTFSLSTAATWQLASGLFGIAGLVTSVHVTRYAVAVGASGVQTRGWGAFAIAFGTPQAANLLLVLNAAGIWGTSTSAIYQVCLLLYLSVAGFAFGLIMLSFLGGEAPPGAT